MSNKIKLKKKKKVSPKEKKLAKTLFGEDARYEPYLDIPVFKRNEDDKEMVSIRQMKNREILEALRVIKAKGDEGSDMYNTLLYMAKKRKLKTVTWFTGNPINP